MVESTPTARVATIWAFAALVAVSVTALQAHASAPLMVLLVTLRLLMAAMDVLRLAWVMAIRVYAVSLAAMAIVLIQLAATVRMHKRYAADRKGIGYGVYATIQLLADGRLRSGL